MRVIVVAALVSLIHGSYATLLIKGPNRTVLEGETVTLECVIPDSEVNITKVYYEISTKDIKAWHPVRPRIWPCMSMGRTYGEWPPDPRVMSILASRYREGAYRCMSKAGNVTDYSQPLYLNVQYLSTPSLSMEGYTRYMSVPDELRVRVGDSVVVNCSADSSQEPTYYWSKDGGDWILPSSTLSLRKISAMDEGRYTCVAKHPSVESLTTTRAIEITVLSEDAPWYETSNGRLILMTSAAAVSLLVFILSMTVFLCRRAKQAKTNKGPIDDRSQKKPIYRASVESLPSTCADKQPLV